MNEKRVYHTANLDCANCAAKVETAINNITGVESATLDFFHSKLTVVLEHPVPELWQQVEKIAKKTEPEIVLTPWDTEQKTSDIHKKHDHTHHAESHSCSSDACTLAQSRTVESVKAPSWFTWSLGRVLISLLLFALGAWVFEGTVSLVLLLGTYVLIGWDVLFQAAKNILRGKVFDENFLMSLATIGAIIIGDYAEAAAVMIFYQTGEYFQDYAVRKSRKSIADLMDIRPDTATIVIDGTAMSVQPETVMTGSIIRILPGERIPLDAKVISGTSYIDTRALTGEPVPRSVHPGDDILSGCVNTTGVLEAEVTKPYGDSTVSRILQLVEESGSRKAEAEQFITKFARWYTPIVVIAAVLLALLPPLFGAGTFSDWVYRALIFLVISCPCALVISIPLSFFGGIGGGARQGILVKGGNYLQTLADVDTLVFDKTGTLTMGNFAVQKVVLNPALNLSEAELVTLAASAEQLSTHPIARSITEAATETLYQIKDTKEFPGKGVSTFIDNDVILAGNLALLEEYGVDIKLPSSLHEEAETLVHIAVNGVYAGSLFISDTLKPSAEKAIIELKELGIKNTAMLTGDRKSVANAIAAKLHIDEVHAELLPHEKVSALETIMTTTSHKLAYVGDGINDAPVLALADVGIAMGAMGSDAAIEAADIVIMTDEPDRIGQAIRIARKTMSIVKQNIVFALGVKMLVMLLGALGIASMWMAIFADVGVAFLAILNAMRALKKPKHV